MKDPLPASPVVAGLVLLGVGLLVRSWEPAVLRLPEPAQDVVRNDRGIARAARVARDGIAAVLPRNLTKSVARSMMIVGAGLVLVRALDELVHDEDALF